MIAGLVVASSIRRGRAMLPVARAMVAQALGLGVKIVVTHTGHSGQLNRQMADEVIALAEVGLPPNGHQGWQHPLRRKASARRVEACWPT
jgi:hypothetical protein